MPLKLFDNVFGIEVKARCNGGGSVKLKVEPKCLADMTDGNHLIIKETMEPNVCC